MEILAFGLPLIGGAIMLRHRPSITGICFGVSAWFAAFGEARQFFKARLAVYMAEARERGAA